MDITARDLERFWAKVDKTGDCWEWTGSRHGFGYGFFSLGGKTRRAHRISYELVNEPIPDGLVVCHRCDNPPCVNPDHLFLGTRADNAHDAIAKGRMIGGLLNVAEAIQLYEAGASANRIAGRLGVSRKTIEYHLKKEGVYASR